MRSVSGGSLAHGTSTLPPRPPSEAAVRARLPLPGESCPVPLNVSTFWPPMCAQPGSVAACCVYNLNVSTNRRRCVHILRWNVYTRQRTRTGPARRVRPLVRTGPPGPHKRPPGPPPASARWMRLGRGPAERAQVPRGAPGAAATPPARAVRPRWAQRPERAPRPERARGPAGAAGRRAQRRRPARPAGPPWAATAASAAATSSTRRAAPWSPAR